MIYIGDDEMLWNRYEEAIACASHIVSGLKEQGNEDAFLEAQRKLQILEDQKARNAK